MRNFESIIIDFRNSATSPEAKFELIDELVDSIKNSQQVLTFAALIEFEPNAIIRHEISAQLLRIKSKNPELISPINNEIEDTLIKVIKSDLSIVSRHEAIEALSLIGSLKSDLFLTDLAIVEPNKDILDTIKISLPIIKKRTKIDPIAFGNCTNA